MRVLIILVSAVVIAVLLNIVPAALTVWSGKNFFFSRVYCSGKIFILYIAAKTLVMLKIAPCRVMRIIISLNNRLVKIINKNYQPKNVLVLLPRCLQNQSCVNAVVEEISNCKSCGRCDIGNLKDMNNKDGASILLATGGEIAVDYIAKRRPDYVVAVACEKELFMGIGEIRKIPVYAVLNEQPEGPCKNTRVDMKLVLDALKK